MREVRPDGRMLSRPRDDGAVGLCVPVAVGLIQQVGESHQRGHTHDDHADSAQQGGNPLGQPGDAHLAHVEPQHVREHDHGQQQVGVNIRKVGRIDRAHHQSAHKEGGQPFEAGHLRAGLDQRHGPDQHEQRQRQDDHVRVQVAVEEGEQRELGDGHVIGRHHAARIPVPVAAAEGQDATRQRVEESLRGPDHPLDDVGVVDDPARGGHALEALVDHADRPKVAEGHGHHRSGQARHQRQVQQTFVPVGGRLERPLQQGMHHRKRAQRHQREQRRQDQVVRDGRHDAEPFHRRADQHEAIVIVIDVAARKPRVISGEGTALQHRVEVREIHRALAALGGMPQVGVAEAHQQVEEEEAEKDQLDGQEEATVGPPLFEQLSALHPADAQACRRQPGEYQPDRQPRIRQPDGTRQPREVGQQRQPEDATQRVRVYAQPRQGQPRQRIGHHTEGKDEEVPEEQSQHGITILEGIVTEQLRPGAAGLLLLPAIGRKQQVFVLIRVGLARREMHRAGQVHRPEDGLHLGGIVVRTLLEDQHLGVIVEGEGLLRRLVVDGDRAQRGIGGEDRHQVIAQAAPVHAWLGHAVTADDVLARGAADQLAVVLRRQRITLGQAGDLSVLVVGGDEDVIALVERIDQAHKFVGVVVPIDLQVQVAAIQAAEGIILHAEGQGEIVVGFVDDGRPRQHDGATAGRHRDVVRLAGREGQRLGQGQRDGAAARIRPQAELILGGSRGGDLRRGLAGHGHGQGLDARIGQVRHVAEQDLFQLTRAVGDQHGRIRDLERDLPA